MSIQLARKHLPEQACASLGGELSSSALEVVSTLACRGRCQL